MTRHWPLLRRFSHIAWLSAVVACSGVRAEDRALLLGVGDYDTPLYEPLPGVRHDLAMMQEVAELMGFSQEQTKILSDADASLRSVDAALQTWLVDGVDPTDRVLFYFSGHGARIPDRDGDETRDDADEVLVMHDVRNTRRNGRDTLENVLIDDRFGELIAQIPSNNVTVIVDACHSGTVTRGPAPRIARWGETETTPKLFSYVGMPALSRDGLLSKASAPEQDELNYVLLAAAGDDQTSLSTRKGSLFTLALYESVRLAAQQQRILNPSALHQAITRFVEQNLNPGAALFKPAIAGSQRLGRTPFVLASLREGNGPNWRLLKQSVERANALRISLDQDRYEEGDTLELSLHVSKPGYLNVINVDAHDNATILFPNALQPDNRVDGQIVSIPARNMDFQLQAQPPYGPALVAAFVSDEPVNLYGLGAIVRDSQGLTQMFRELSVDGRSLLRAAIEFARGSYLAGLAETFVCPRQLPCQSR